jgi:hypothetical protein
MYIDLLRMEGAVKASNLDWTILRPPRLTDEPRTGRYHVGINAVRRIRADYRPNMPVCILLADHWGINPNELLTTLAGWPALKAFDIQTESAAHLPPEAVEVAKEIGRIPNPGTRKAVAKVILVLVRKYFE